METPTKAPTTITAGLTVEWEESFSDYHYSDGYTKAYYTISGSSAAVKLDGVYADDFWTFTLKAAENVLPAGQYVLFGCIEKGSGADVERHEVYRGQLTVQSGLTTATATDQRTWLQKQLDLIESAITTYSTNPVEEVSILGRAYRRPTLLQLYQFRALLKKELREERRKQNIANGRPANKTILARFANT